jgi:hypothetical protein
LYTTAFDKVERFVDIFELLHAQLGARGIAAEGLVAQDFEEVDEDYLGLRVSVLSGSGKAAEGLEGTGTHAV